MIYGVVYRVRLYVIMVYPNGVMVIRRFRLVLKPVSMDTKGYRIHTLYAIEAFIQLFSR